MLALHGWIRETFRIRRDPGTPKFNLELIRQFWQLTSAFWRWNRPRVWVSYLVLGIFTAYTFGLQLLGAVSTKYTGDQLNALAARDTNQYYHVIIVLALLAMIRTVIQTLSEIPYRLLLTRWRQWLTQEYIAFYLQNRSYYRLNRDRIVDNPDERIAVDISQFIEFPTALLFRIIQSVSNLFIFGWVLWHIAWYLVPASALVFGIYGVVDLFLVRPVMTLNYSSRKLEGDFRFSLVNVRTHAESIAFLGGEDVERRELANRNNLLIDNARRLVWWDGLITAWHSFNLDLQDLLPGLLLVPLFLAGKLTLSAFTQSQFAWRMFGEAFVFWGREAQVFPSYGAIVARLSTLRAHCIGDQPDSAADPHIAEIRSPNLAAENLTLVTPDGSRVLVQGLNFSLQHGSRMIVNGSNGVGKSSLLRGLAGLWTRGSGTVLLPPRDKLMFLPQRPYVSLGTLGEQLTYPAQRESVSDDALCEVLGQVGLSYLEKRVGGLSAKLDWNNVLSPGEQQRLAFGRALLRHPEFVILDEATSAIDVEGERLLYDLLRAKGCSYLSVAHRVSLYPYHDTVLELKGEGAWELHPILQAQG